MCGIAGIVLREDRVVDRSLLQKLATALAHRGPDGSGFFVKGSVGLVHTRLAIMDVDGGTQPFETPEGVALIANGEIYNDLDIREKLSDVVYQSGSDCESALHLYENEGVNFVDGLRGMYALALYDSGPSTLILTRDPFGIKQLYYISTPAFFAFASEPQALRAAGLAEGALRPTQRNELLQLKFTTGAETIYEDIYRVLPGETLVIVKGEIVARRKRRLVSKDKARVSVTPRQACAQLDDILTESVSAHLRADVPYGLFLSGGIDSSVLAALMARLSPQPVRMFTASFPEFAALDETQKARRVARAVKADHHIVPVTGKDFWAHLPRVAAALDDPTADASALPTFLLAHAAKKYLKVVLSGEGADEIFGGYSRYRRTQSFLRFLGQRKGRSHGIFDSFVPPKGLFEKWREGLSRTEEEEKSALWSPLQTLQAVDCAEWLPNDLLVKFDRCLMAHGLEGRTPFLDPLVAAFGFPLPDTIKVQKGMGKWILRQWLSDTLPEAEAWAKKAGFNPPVGHWIAAHKQKIEPLLLSHPALQKMAAEPLVKKVFLDPLENAQAAWNLTFYALWYSHHILGISAEGNIGDVLDSAANLG